MDPIALYYPYIHVRDDTWLKYAALYWPKMARLRPREYLTLDSSVARVLRDDAKWLTDITPPRWAADQVGAPFLELINTYTPVLRDRFGLNRVEQWESIASRLGHDNRGTVIRESSQFWHSIPNRRRSAPRLDPRLGYVHADKIDPYMIDAAVDAGVAILVLGRPGSAWVGMHPMLASVYTCALIERIAIGDHLHPITDQTLPHAALSGWDLDRLVQALIAEPSDADSPRLSPDLLDAFVFLAFQTVVPADLDTVPIEKIIEVRSRFGTELDAFREYVAQQTQRLAELDDVRDLPVYHEYLRTEVQRTVTRELDQLREKLRSVGLESVKALANVKSVGLPPLAAMAADTIGLSPTITGPAVLAACVVTAPAQWRRQRRAAIQESPTGYLFQLGQALNPTTMIDRIRQVWPG